MANQFYMKIVVILFVVVLFGRSKSLTCKRHRNVLRRVNSYQFCQQSVLANITDEDLITISGQIWDADEDDRINVQLSLQAKTKDDDTTDRAPDPLFATIPTEFQTNPIYAKQIALYADYHPSETIPEPQSHARVQNINDFLDEIMKTKVMKETHDFLASKGVVPSDESAFKDLLQNIWYYMYKRSGALSSSGGEHVQMGETKSDDDIDGFHSWVRFALLEKKGDVNYLGYVRIKNLGGAYVIRNPFFWDTNFKSIGGFFIGTSPAFDMSVYTLCFYSRPDSICNLKFNGHKVPIQTYTMDYMGEVLVGSSYPNY